ncbi:MAG TPA: GNAT family N-acetyltransferase [Candidatus Atribacteria bacterium]|nr:GNAT family N-acetyltransferase [Candidatus Atribacteria bacterium]
MQIAFNNRNDIDYQSKLNKLLKEIFFDFQFWYDLNLWDERYESYSIIENDEIISNICVYKTEILFEGRRYPALSFGAVATRQEHRGRGLSRLLMEHIFAKYPDTPMYLSANEGVLDFYPRFGFRRIYDRLPVCHMDINNDIQPVKLQYNDPRVWDYVSGRVNFSHKLDCLNSASINMFHIHLGPLKDSIYEIPELDTMIIADQRDTTLKLTGVFSLKDISFSQLAKHLPFKNVTRVEFGSMPCWPDVDYTMEEYGSDPLFVRNVTCDLGEFKFPELAFT